MKNLFAFDFDDNILVMDTKLIHTDDNGNTIELSSEQFARLRKKGKIEYSKDSFINFSDQIKNKFLNDTKQALESKSFAPSWNKFKECLISADLFVIITGRGHKSNTILKTIQTIIELYFNRDEKLEIQKNILEKYNLMNLKDYIKLNSAYCVTSDQFVNKFKIENRNNIQNSKVIAMEHYLLGISKKYPNDKFNLGFSDDDPLNISAMKTYLETRKDSFEKIKIYDTSKHILKSLTI